MGMQESIKTVIESLFSVLGKETVEENPDAYAKLKALYEENSNRFFDVIQMGFANIHTLIDAIVEVRDQKNQYLLQFIADGTYQHFHKTRIRQLEGLSCCADKSGFIEQKTVDALKAGENLSLYDDYTHVDRITENKERQAYWSPKTVKDTDEAMALFWEWYNMKSLPCNGGMKSVQILSDYTPLDEPNVLNVIRDDQGDVHISMVQNSDSEYGVRIAASGTRYSPKVREALYNLIHVLEEEKI